MRTECLGSLDSDVKLAAGLQTLDSLFKRTDHAGSNSEYYLFGILRIGLMHKILTRRGHFIEVVAQLYIFSGLNFFHIIICLIFLLPSRAAKTVPAEALSAEYRVKSPDTGRDYHHKENYGDPHGAPCARGIERLILTVGHIGRCASVAFIVRHSINDFIRRLLCAIHAATAIHQNKRAGRLICFNGRNSHHPQCNKKRSGSGLASKTGSSR